MAADQAKDARQAELRASVISELPNVDFVLGYAKGFDPLHATPITVRSEKDAARLIFDATCVQNLTTGLYGLKGKRIGLVVKGCDSRSVVQLLQEKLVERSELVIFGMPCDGVLDLAKIRVRTDITQVRGAEVTGEEVRLLLPDGPKVLPRRDVLADKCLRCRYPNPIVSDHLIGQELTPQGAEDTYADLDGFEKLSPQERFDFWKRQMSRCIRCYACRNACPLCVCKHVCLADSRDPHWLSAEATLQEKWLFQVMHALHLAGRCTECGECQRSCPMGIPILLLKRKMNRELKELFNYEAGVDPEAVPPLHTFLMEEDKIKDRGQLW
ncbi:MAG: 4Fe-4S dicluster domain-containing protein [Humidesulfovibrio sp.]|uniref:4Fe-4S dicluster domain-containing protein n=1 Tax=Humidesulfovibrio sp. TaxID=2910988 RepID=UPI002732CB83|nr:4Fe-4S dicluster domain-containing protein [Humidesulfovibrio sp.]MDP2847111.1 4Fe-4S dicluster domain-containing protein [Humidesulfovibrio sp.]